MPEIRLENLITRFGAVEVLHGIDLSMAENEFTVLVGPSGCGKSTTLRMIAGLETVSEGEIYLDDRPISHLEPKDRNLAMVFQDYALYPYMDVARNILFALRLQKRPKAKIEAKVGEIAHIVSLTDFYTANPAPCRVDSDSASLWHGLWRKTAIFSCSMNLCLTWMPNCADKCAQNWQSCDSASKRI